MNEYDIYYRAFGKYVPLQLLSLLPTSRILARAQIQRVSLLGRSQIFDEARIVSVSKKFSKTSLTV